MNVRVRSAKRDYRGLWFQLCYRTSGLRIALPFDRVLTRCRHSVMIRHDERITKRSHVVLTKNLPTIYFVIGQIGWFACVLSAAHGVPIIGVIFSAVLVVTHLLRVRDVIPELKLLCVVVCIGAVWESVPVATGLLVYPSGNVFPHAAPYWLLALWGLFAAQFNTSFQWLKRRLALAGLLGAIAGPMSFRAGASLGAVHFAKPLPAFILLAVGWGFLMPMLVLLSRRWDGVHDRA